MQQENTASSFRIVYGLIAGVIIGVLLQSYASPEFTGQLAANVTGPIGNIFLRALFMIVVPLVAASLTAGVADLGSIGNLGRYGKKAALFYLTTTVLAVLIGQLAVNVFQPGSGINPDYVASAQEEFKEQTSGLRIKSELVGESLWPGIINKVIPKNILEEWAQTNMLAVIFVAILFGAALLRIDSDEKRTLVGLLHATTHAIIQVVHWIMRIAPYAVACLMINAILAFNVAILGNVAKYMAVVVVGYCLHFFISYGLILKYLIRLNPLDFYRGMMPVFLTAFSTSSSNATLPTTIAHLKARFGVPERVVTFTAPLGATVNMDGTSLFEVVAALFIAQVFGVDLSLTQHITLVVLVVVTSIGVAGVPGGSIPLLMSAMAAVGIPPEGIALVLGVDRLLDMGRTVVNVTGDALCSLFLARADGVDIEKALKANE